MKHCDKKAVTVNVTNNCNLRCTYCMASVGDEQQVMSIPIDFALAGIRDALAGVPTGISAEMLRFFAPGEPTQDMEIIQACVAEARRIRPDLTVELQTNGLFPSPSAANWIARNINMVWFSFDGSPEINDRNRPDMYGVGRSDEIIANMKILQAYNTKVGVRATVTEATTDNQAALVEYFHKLGVRYFAANPVIRPIKRGDSGLKTVNESSQLRFAKGFCKAYELADKLGMEFTNSMTFNFDEPTDVSCRSCIPMPQLNPDGSVSSCDMAMYRDTKTELKDFLYGDWNPETKTINYYPEKIVKLQSHRPCNIPKCAACPIKEYCAGGCLGRIAYQTGDINTVLPEICGATYYMAKHIPLGTGRYTQTHP